MSETSLDARVAAAREMLEEGLGSEYETLPAGQRACLQEAIEYLRRAENTFPGGRRRE